MKKSSDKKRAVIPADFMYKLPIIEFTGDRSVTVEGATGVLKYESNLISINTKPMVINFSGRGLRLKCISPSCVIIEGSVANTEFVR